MNQPTKPERSGDVTVVVVPFDKLDLSTAGEFKEWIAPLVAEKRKIVLDLESVHFVDSSGLGALLTLLRDLTAAGGDMKLCCVERRVRIMFELVRMHRVLSIHDTREDAIASWSEGVGSGEIGSRS
jgi:anti-sigma B factor antagonist